METGKGKIILYGAGRYGKLALEKYGRERVAFFCDTFVDDDFVEGISVIEPDELSEMKEVLTGEYTVVITPEHQWARDEIAAFLTENNIPYEIFDKLDTKAGGIKTVRLYGTIDNLKIEYDDDDIKGFENRLPLSVGMIRKTIETYADVFAGKRLDLAVYIGDHSLDAYYQCENIGVNHIFAYNTAFALSDKVIPIPDYRACYDEEKYAYDEIPSVCKVAAGRSWTDSRIVWRGSLRSDDCRRWLEILGNKHPDILLVEDPITHKEHDFVPMLELVKHKYLLDIRGYGWSDRLKILLQLGRPIFMVARPFKEWFTDYLEPWKHYVPVKEDLSDLIENYHYMEEHLEKYDEIVSNMRIFADKYLAPEAVLSYMKDTILKYGVVREED